MTLRNGPRLTSCKLRQRWGRLWIKRTVGLTWICSTMKKHWRKIGNWKKIDMLTFLIPKINDMWKIPARIKNATKTATLKTTSENMMNSINFRYIYDLSIKPHRRYFAFPQNIFHLMSRDLQLWRLQREKLHKLPKPLTLHLHIR